MRIFVDADARPIVKETERLAKQYGIPVVLHCDTNHILTSDYSEVKVISAGAELTHLLEGLLKNGGARRCIAKGNQANGD